MDIAKIKELMRQCISFSEMSIKGMIPDVVTYSTLIRGFFLVERLQAVLELFHKMQDCGECPSPQTYAILLDDLCKNKKIGEAMALFQEMEDNKSWTTIL